MKRVHIFVEGKVQGVGFRHFTKTNAQKLNITGWVKNLPDGRVEAVLEGDEDLIESMIDLIKRGPRASQVTDVDIKWESPELSFDDFRVTYI